MSTETVRPAAKNIALKDIVIDPGIQPRDSIDAATVTEYAAAIEAGANMPPAVVFDTGVSRYLAGGFQRHAAHLQLGKRSLACIVYQGTYEDAWIFARGDNKHGKHFTNDEKNRIVSELLDNPVTGQWTDRKIALHVGVSHPFVAQIRQKRLVTVTSQTERIGADGRTYKVPPRPVPLTPEETRSDDDFDDTDPFEAAYLEMAAPPDAQAPPEDWQQTVVDDIQIDTAPAADEPAPELDGYGRPVTVPGGVYVETKTEVINADMPEEPRAAAPLTQAEEDALDSEAWLDTLPLRAKLREERMPPNIFERAAVDYRALRKPLTSLRHEINRTIDGSASDDFTARMRAVAATPHPKDWKFSRENTGGFQLW